MIDAIRKMDIAGRFRDYKTKTERCLGLEFDSCGARALRIVRTVRDKEIRFKLDGIQAVDDNLSKDEDLVECLRSLKEQLDVTPRDRVVTSITGRHVYVAQMPFRRLPASQMKEALKLELRKQLTFDTSKSMLEYQPVKSRAGEAAKQASVLVSVVSNDLIERQLGILKKADLKPVIMDVFPYAVANAFWAGEEEEGDPSAAHVVIHMSSEVYTVVFEGDEAPFYSRSIYLAARSASMKQPDGTSAPRPDRQRQLMAFNEELKRTISYYKTTHQIGNISDLYLVGDPEHIQAFLESDQGKIGLPVRESRLHERFGAPDGWLPGKFDVAAALALRR